MGEVRKIGIKKRTYHFYNDMINLKDFDANLLKIDITKELVFTTLDASRLKKLMIVKVFTV